MSLTLLFDDFSGNSVNAAIWHYPTGPASFYGRTQIRADYPSISDGIVHLQLDKHNPTALLPGDSFFGSEIISNQTFARGIGLTVEFSARLAPPLSPGLVGAGFLYEIFGGTRQHSEIVYELPSNLVNSSTDDSVLTNIYADEPFGVGKPIQLSIPGLDVSSFNVYRIEWHQERVLWFINDHLVREESELSPSDNLELHFNLWASRSDFILAYSPLLQPVSNPALNTTFLLDLDWVRVSDKIDFQPLNYIASYTDLIDAFGLDTAAATQHYIDHGRNEGRSIQFESLEYIASYSDLMDVLGANTDAGATHYILYGRTEGRDISFDGLAYIASYNDLIEAFGANSDAGSTHFIGNGRTEGRTVSFEGLQYIASYGDLIEAFGANSDAGSTHYIIHGVSEGRAKDSFDADRYLSNYPDLQAAFGSDLEAATIHYIEYGFEEGRADDVLMG